MSMITKRSKDEKNQYLKNAITMLATCNNVSPTIENSTQELKESQNSKKLKDTQNSDKNVRVLQASSPDEIAFVEFTDAVGYFMENRKNDSIRFKNCNISDAIVR